MKNQKHKEQYVLHGKVPPQAIDLEKAILGALLIDTSGIKKVVDFLKADMFYKQAHIHIYEAILSLYADSKPIDILTVNNEASKAGHLDIIGGSYYIMQLSSGVSSSANVVHHARVIQEKYVQRELINISSSLIKEAYSDESDPIKLLDETESVLTKLQESTFKTEDKKLIINDFPLDIFPDFVQEFINAAYNSENFSKDFMAVSFMSAYAACAGNRLKLKYSNTWEASLIFWFVIVGNPGSKKSHPVKLMLNPLKKIDREMRKDYDVINTEYQIYQALDKQDKKHNVKIDKPIDKQIIIKNTTLEALHNAHKDNLKGLLYYRDEIEGWVTSMNQYRGGKGDDMTNWLSMFDGDDISINRVSKDRLVMDETNVNLIGTTQPARISSIPADNGLLHRLLFTNSDSNISGLKFDDDISQTLIDDYQYKMNYINNAYSSMESVKKYTLSSGAQEVSKQIDSYLIKVQKDEKETPIIKQYCEKLKSYIPRFELLLADCEAMFNKDHFGLLVEKHHAEGTFKLVKYFLSTARQLFQDQQDRADAKNIAGSFKHQTNEDKAIAMLEKGVTVSQIAGELNVSRATIYNYKKKAVKGKK